MQEDDFGGDAPGSQTSTKRSGIPFSCLFFFFLVYLDSCYTLNFQMVSENLEISTKKKTAPLVARYLPSKSYEDQHFRLS